MIYGELCAQGVDNWSGYDYIHFPDISEVEAKLNKFNDYVKPIKEDDVV